MSLLHYPHCPRCQGELPIDRLYSEGRTWNGIVLIGDGSVWGGLLTAGNTGIVCPSCGTRLLVLQSYAVWGSWLLVIVGAVVPAVFIGGIAACFHIDSLHIDKNSVATKALWLVAVAFAGSWIYFLTRYSRRFVQLRPLERGEHAAFPLSKHEQAE